MLKNLLNMFQSGMVSEINKKKKKNNCTDADFAKFLIKVNKFINKFN